MYAYSESQPLATVSPLSRQPPAGSKRSPLTVRWPETTDRKALATLFAAPEVLSWTVELPGNPPVKLQSQPSPSDESYVLLACEDSTIAGAISLSVCPADQKRHVGSIGSLVIGREHRSQEIGVKLMKSALYLADHWLHLKRLQLAVLADNDVALKVFRRFGFGEEGRLQDCALPGDDHVDAILMSRVKADNA